MKRIIQKLRHRGLNFFDVIVLCILVAIFGTLIFVRYAKRTEWIAVRLVVANDEWWWEGNPPQYWYANDIQIGQTANNTFGEKVAEITNIENFDIGGYKRRIFVDMKVKGSYDKKRNVYIYNFQPIQIGKPLELTFGKYNIRGLVSYLGDDTIVYTQKHIEVKMYQVRPETAYAYKKGQTMMDSLGRSLATIEEVRIEQATTYVFSDIRGQMMQVTNPDFRDATITLAVKTFESGGRTYFIDRADIKLGEKIWFQFPNVAIRDAEITKIFD